MSQPSRVHRFLTICLKYIANLTLAQVKTLDCGSLRLNDFPFQLTLPGTKISTLPEMFDFVKCATDDEILFNIESKVDGDFRNLTRTPEDFAEVSGTTGFEGKRSTGRYRLWSTSTPRSDLRLSTESLIR